MDFGTVNFGPVGSNNETNSSSPKSSHGSEVFLKQERSEPFPASSADQEQQWRSSKTPRTEPFEYPTIMHPIPRLRSNSGFHGDGSQTMLSFSTGDTKNSAFLDRTTQTPVYPFYSRNAGHGSGGEHTGLHVPISRYKGPFTPSQWMELEHQAVIYKHIVSNVPVPPNLLAPLRKSFNHFLFSGSSSGSYAPNSFGWGTFHLGFSGSTDPEPGRCRRTDGKKWRCSRDVVLNQKYCERHTKRGRQCSRKPVEGRKGRAVSGPASSKAGPLVDNSSSSAAASAIPASCASNTQLQRAGAANSTPEVFGNRTQESRTVSVLSPPITLKSKDFPFSIPRQHNPNKDSSQSDFGLVSSDSLLCPSEKSSYMYSTNYNPFMGHNDQNTHNQNPLHHFIDEWPKDQSEKSNITWPKELKSDWTQLSMSIPISSSDFSSSSNSPTNDKLTLSPLSLAHQFGPTHIGLGARDNGTQKQEGNWKPVSWGNIMGGPLGEVLNSKNSLSSVGPEMWGGNSYLGFSPTGVLQKSTFVSLSNSSSGSSPRTNKGEGPYDVLGSTPASSASIPSTVPKRVNRPSPILTNRSMSFVGGNVAFSWEDLPGISKFNTHKYPSTNKSHNPKQKYPSFNNYDIFEAEEIKTIPPPPPFSFHEPPRRSLSKRFLWKINEEEKDPFLEALKRCTKNTIATSNSGCCSKLIKFCCSKKMSFGNILSFKRFIPKFKKKSKTNLLCKGFFDVEENTPDYRLPIIPRERFQGLIKLQESLRYS